MLVANRADIDGFYGEPAERDPALEVELELLDDGAFDDERVTGKIHRLVEVAPTAALIALDAPSLEDAWFGSFDENAPLEEFDDMPTTTWKKIGSWLKNLGRAA